MGALIFTIIVLITLIIILTKFTNWLKETIELKKAHKTGSKTGESIAMINAIGQGVEDLNK